MMHAQISFPNLSFPDFKGRILFDVPMKEYTSIKIGGPADVMVFPKDADDLIAILKFASNKGFPVFVMGSGTNLLVRDNGIRGIVINLSDDFHEIVWTGDDKVTAGAGVRLMELANLCRDKGLSGLEFAVGIPGAIGGSVFMNAGAYGGEMKDVIEKIEAVDIKGKMHTFDKASLKFSYRKCELPADMIITKVYLRLQKGSPDEIKKRMKECKDKRKAAQAINLPNAGSIFKNPQGSSAGMLMEESGLKGVKIGRAQISEAHGNYIVNLGHASARDVLALIAIARDKIFKIKGILLETEIKVIGED